MKSRLKTPGQDPGIVAFMVLLLNLMIFTIVATPLHTSAISGRPSATHLITLSTTSTVAVESVEYLEEIHNDEEADAASYNDYYLTCAGDDKLSTQYCQQHSLGYYCASNGALANTGKEYIFCEAACECKRLHPVPGCIYLRGLCFDVLNATDVDGFNQTFTDSHNDSPASLEARALVTSSAAQQKELQNTNPEHDTSETGTTTINTGLSTAFIEQRDTEEAAHSWAIVCIEREWTKTCSGNPYKYTCTKTGHVEKKQLDLYCDAICSCVDIDATPRCFRNPGFMSTCFSGSVDGDEDYGNAALDSGASKDLSDTADLALHTPGQLPMYCGINGTIDSSMTKSCQTRHYFCSLAAFDGQVRSVLRSGSEEVDECANNCHCAGNAARLQFEAAVAAQLNPQPEAEEQQAAELGSLEATGVSVYYCIVQTQPYTFEIDMRLVEFCLNEQYKCQNPSPLDVKGFAPSSPSQNRYPKCIDQCHCVHFGQHNNIDVRFEVMPALAAREEVAADSMADYRMTCVDNFDVTSYCVRVKGYWCDENGVLQPGKSINRGCAAICQCELRDQAHELKAKNSDLSQRGLESTEIAPPAGVPSQTIDKYTLNCGNTEDGSKNCGIPSLGYFCDANMNVARTSTETSQQVTWCNNFCTCQFKYALPCQNEFSVNTCIEWWDGTVRDATRTNLVLGLVKDAIIGTNGWLLLDKAENGFPYWIV